MRHETKPLVLLDVDGVINDLGSLCGLARPWRMDKVLSHGHVVHIPAYMPALIQAIDSVAEIHWCTTWRHRANDEIAGHLGVGPLPVVDDGTTVRWVGWKPGAAYNLAGQALASRRRVIWIEDFYGDPPVDEMPPGVEFIDTAQHGDDAVLLPEMVMSLLDLWKAA